MFMHNPRYVGIQVPRLTRPRFICCAGELRFYFYSRLERARFKCRFPASRAR